MKTAIASIGNMENEIESLGKDVSSVAENIKKFGKQRKTSVSQLAHEARTIRATIRILHNKSSRLCREFAGIR